MKSLDKLGILSAVALSLLSYSDKTPSTRTLFIGNSVFNYQGGIAQSFEGFCRTESLDHEAVSQLNTPRFPHGIEFIDFGRIPLNLPEVAASEALHEHIRNGDFDYVILEARRSGYLLPEVANLPEDRGSPISYSENLRALAQLHETIVSSGAQTVLYMHPGIHLYPDVKLPTAQIYHRLQKDLEDIEIQGAEHKVILVPALYLWLDAALRYGTENWFANPGHGNALARYASGCLVYTFLTGKDPRKNPFDELPKSFESGPDSPTRFVPASQANWIKKQVWLYYTASL
jgi:serine/threonine protein kinase